MKILSAMELAILQDVGFFRYYTISQLERHRYGRSHNWAGEMLLRLWDPAQRRLDKTRKYKGGEGWLRRFPMPRPTHNPAIKTEWVYTLNPKGARVLANHEIAVTPPPEEYKRDEWFLLHTLAVNDFLIAARVLERTWNNIEIPWMEHELWLKRHPGYVDLEGKKRAISSDAFCLIRANGVSYPILLELDRGSESRDFWLDKIKRLVPYIEGSYKERYKTDLATVAVVAHLKDPEAGQRRRRELKRWTEQALITMGKQKRGDIFQFSCLLPSQTPPLDYFFEKHWHIPFRKEEEFRLLDL